MPYWVMKSGLDLFDVSTAYGLAVFLDAVSPEESTPMILDSGSHYLLELDGDVAVEQVGGRADWAALFEEVPQDRTWSRVFLTDKQKWQEKRNKVKAVLEKEAKGIVEEFSTAGSFPAFSSGGETVPGPLDPSAFKGLRGRTRGDYSEGQTKVDAHHWALACLGAATAARYRVQKSTGNKWDYFVLVPVPERVELRNFREVRDRTKGRALQYLGVKNAAAHYALVLAETLRAMAASRLKFQDRFSTLLYFSLFQSGQQFKPAAGGFVDLQPLMTLALSKPDESKAVFEVWDYLFRRGSVRGCEDLAQAITELVGTPSPRTYWQHARIFLRYVASKEIKGEHLYNEDALKEVMKYADS